MSRRFAVTIDCSQPIELARFWCDLLGYIEDPVPAGFDSWQDFDQANGVPAEQAESGCTIIDPDGDSPRLYFQRVAEPKAGKNRVHLDVVASERRHWSDVQALADHATGLGGTILRVSQNPDDRFIVLSDPEGNEFCLVL